MLDGKSHVGASTMVSLRPPHSMQNVQYIITGISLWSWQVEYAGALPGEHRKNLYFGR